MSTPTIANIPTAYKAGKIYSQLPVDGSADFDVARNSTATRVNQNGLIEEVAVNVPRLDYTNGGCPVWLREPQSTNKVTYSEDFSQSDWGKARVTVQAGQSDVFGGSGAYLVSNTTDTDSHALIHSTITGLTASTSHSISCFIKKGTSNKVMLRDATIGGYLAYDFENDTVLDTNSLSAQSVVDYGSGWYRVSITTISSGSGQLRPSVYILEDSYVSGSPSSYTGSTSENLIVTGFQLEEQPDSTSYIPTSGSTVTRLADEFSLDTSSLGLSEITETFSDNSTNVVTPVPSNYVVSEGKIKKIEGE